MLFICLYFDHWLKILSDCSWIKLSSHLVSATVHHTLTCLTTTTQKSTTTTSLTLRIPASSMSPASSISLLPSFSQRANLSGSPATRIVRNYFWTLLNLSENSYKVTFICYKCVCVSSPKGLLCCLPWACMFSYCSSCSTLLKALTTF